MLYQFDNFVIRSTANEICQKINRFYVTGQFCDTPEVFVDLDSLFSGVPQAQILYKLLSNFEGEVFATSNEEAAKKLGLRFVKLQEDVIHEPEITPEKPGFNLEHLFDAANMFNNILQEGSFLRSPGRGSCCNCPQFYELGLTDIDPQRFDLHPSRFFGFRKEKIDIDIDLCGNQISTIVKEFNRGKNFKLIKKLSDDGKPHRSSHILCSIDDVKNGHVLFKRLKNTGELYVSKSSLPIFDLLSLNVLEDMNNVSWRSIVDMVTNKPLQKWVFQIGDNQVAQQLWDSMDAKNIDDIAFVNASIRTGARTQLKRIGEPYHIAEVDDVLKDTYYCLVYQDQINEILANVFNLDLNRADFIRKNLNAEIIKKLARILKQSGSANSDILRFCKTINDCKDGYIFCKGHSLSYAAIILSQLEFGTKNEQKIDQTDQTNA